MKRMIIVDGNSLMYRAFYGLKAETKNSKGLPTNAIYGFVRMINNLINTEYDNILVAFDAGKKTIRHQLMEDYKAGRSPMPDEFRMQIPYIKQYLDLMRIKQYEQDLYEADDIIGTMSKVAEENGYHVDIYSSDKDLLQLISDNVTVHMNKKGMTEIESYTPAYFLEKYGINSTQFVDLKALMGDKSDNLIGIPNVGEKSGIKLLQQYNTLENIIDHKDEIKGALGENIRTYYESAILTKKMATILRSFDIKLTLDDTKKKECNMDELLKFYNELEFKSLLKNIEIETPISVEKEYVVIKDSNDLDKVLVNDSSLIFETYEYNYHKCPILAIGVANQNGLFIIDPNLIYSNMDLMFYLQDKNIKKNIFDYKKSYVLLKRLGIELNGIDFDLLLASYIINPSINQDEFRGIATMYSYDDCYFDEQIYGKGAKKHMPELDLLYQHIAKKADALMKLKPLAIKRLEEHDQLKLLNEIEIPLSKILGNMEFNGMKIDMEELNNQATNLEADIKNLENTIKTIANKDFNIASPKQLGEVLFEDLAIPYPKKKGNSYSTDIDILNSIKDKHEIVKYVIEYRAKTKLYSTYLIGIKEAIYPDGKVHTIFQQALTNTGRLSSIEPNLQNISIRTEEGHKIRKIFVPSEGYKSFYSADYSQIELRVLASIANVKGLINAFNNGEDIHAETAKKVFGKEEITPLDRRRAKAVNFGIVYGISAFGLAQDLGIKTWEADDFIKKYYQTYPEIKEYMDSSINSCKLNGYVKTLENRIRYVPEMNSNNYMIREFAKRVAMNAPIQGSAADIIKIAMIKVSNSLEANNLKSRMIVQVHDELVFEVYPGEEDKLQRIVRDSMQNAYKLSVPLIVDDSFGTNWYEVK